MCGIVGAIGHHNASSALYEALQRLEYRGYDSAGIATWHQDALHRRRSVGKLRALGAVLQDNPLEGDCGIGHTRWATHGHVSEENAHPIMSGQDIAVVHNGIIENHKEIKQRLIENGHEFSSQTDTEVLSHLFKDAIASTDSFKAATAHVLDQIEGAYAFAVMSSQYPHQIAIARNASPLAVGLGKMPIILALMPWPWG